MDTTRQGSVATLARHDSGCAKPEWGAPRYVTIDEFCRLALSRRHLVRQSKGFQQGLLDEVTGESYWIDESRIWSLG